MRQRRQDVGVLPLPAGAGAPCSAGDEYRNEKDSYGNPRDDCYFGSFAEVLVHLPHFVEGDVDRCALAVRSQSEVVCFDSLNVTAELPPPQLPLP